MPCNSPLKGWIDADTGGITFDRKKSYGFKMEVPCGQCMGCKLAKTAEWATRCMHESQSHDDNCFLTLTYNDANLPKNQTLVKEDLQLFWKKFRKWLEPTKIRYYACGEYGDNSGRPHYHAIIFNYWPEDTEIYKDTNFGTLYTNTKIEQIWGKGFVTIGNCSYESCAYVASYVTKKLNGGERIHGKETDTRFKYRNRIPEFGTMSRRPGIGMDWYQNFKQQTINSNSVVTRGRETRPPQYYKNLLKEDYPKESFAHKIQGILDRHPDESYERIETMEKFLHEKLKFFAKDNIE